MTCKINFNRFYWKIAIKFFSTNSPTTFYCHFLQQLWFLAPQVEVNDKVKSSNTSRESRVKKVSAKISLSRSMHNYRLAALLLLMRDMTCGIFLLFDVICMLIIGERSCLYVWRENTCAQHLPRLSNIFLVTPCNRHKQREFYACVVLFKISLSLNIIFSFSLTLPFAEHSSQVYLIEK